jgi:hypothetical protein
MMKEKEVDITVENKLGIDKREINVYHHARKNSHLISFNSTISTRLKTSAENDYIHISVGRGPGDLKNGCSIHIPSGLDFQFSSEGKVTITHTKTKTGITLPPGPPTWELKLSWSGESPVHRRQEVVTIGDIALVKG